MLTIYNGNSDTLTNFTIHQTTFCLGLVPYNHKKTVVDGETTMKQWGKPALAVLCGLLAARCDFLQDMYPFGGALLCVLNESRWFSFLFFGAAIGAVSTGINVGEMLLALLPLVLLLPPLLLLKRKKVQSMLWRQLFVFLAYAVPALVLHIDFYERVFQIFSGLLAVCLIPLLKRIVLSVSQLESRLSLERADILALGCVGGLILSSLPRTDFFGFNLCIFALLFSSALAVCAFEGAGSVWASTCGIMWVVKGGDSTVALCLIAGGIFAGILSSKKGGILLGFLLGDMLISLFFLNTFAISMGIVNLVLGCAYTVFLKAEWIERLRRLAGVRSGVNDLEMSYIEGLRQQQSEKLKGAGRMYAELSKAFTAASRNQEFRSELIERTVQICRECDKCEYCLKSRKSDTLIELGQAADELIEREKLSGLPLTLTARCVRPMELMEGMKLQFRTLVKARRENPDESMEMAQQLRSISEMLFSLAEDLSELPQFDKERELAVKEVLASRIGGVKQVVCRKNGESHSLQITLKECTKDTQNKICNALEAGFLGKYRCLSGGMNKNGGFTGTFAAEPRFKIDAYACRKSKNGEEVCGDSFTFCNVNNDKYIAAISDGAGSGEKAAKESESALDLLEAFTATQMKRNDMFKAMNQLLLLKGDKEAYSTMDVAEFNLEDGILYWTKIGAVPGYIVRDGKVEKVEAGALPMGIVSKINPTTTKKLVQNGDIIILLSDGVYDGLCRGEEDMISRMLTQYRPQDTKQLAEQLLESAKETKIDDDMTVMVLRVDAA